MCDRMFMVDLTDNIFVYCFAETSFQARAQKFSSMEEKETNIDLTHSQKPPTEDTPLLSSSPEPQPIKPLRKLLNAIFPFVSSSYKSSSIFSKIFQIVKVC